MKFCIFYLTYDIFLRKQKILTLNKSLHLCKKKKRIKLILDISKNIQINLIAIKYN